MKKKIIILILLLLTIQLVYSFGKNKIQQTKLYWSKIKTLHFDIYFNRGDDEFGEILALMAEEAYYYIKKDLKTPIYNRIPVVFYKSHQEFETTNIIFPLLDEGVGGFTELSKNRIAVPFDGSYKKMEETFVHELTHAYINELDRGRNKFFSITGLPFWFSEGFPEFESVGGKDCYNNMFVIDMLMNEGLYDLDRIGGYFAYRLGESFLVYIEEVYGRQYVIELFYALRISSSVNLAMRKVFGLDFTEIQLRWKNYLKRKYYRYIEFYDVPYEVYERKTDFRKDGSYLNFAPRFSPDGQSFLYFSNKNIKTDIWKGSTFGIIPNRKIISGESSGKFEEFHFQKNNISWFPDGNRFAFVSKTSTGDKIYVINYLTHKIIYEFSFAEFDAIYEIDISHDGERIAFSGQKNLKNDIYLFEIASEKITSITDDYYYDSQPRWSPDDNKIVFTSERSINPILEHEQLFEELNSDIFYYDVLDDKFFKVTNDEFSNHFPFWNHSNEKILFISEKEFASNFEIIDITNGKRATVTKSLGGVFTGDIDKNKENLIFSCYYNGGWDIYIKSNPLDGLEYKEYQLPQEIKLISDFYSRFEIDNYKYYGKKPRKFKRGEQPFHPDSVTEIDLRKFSISDSLNEKYNKKLDEKPTEINFPEISPYKVKFSLDYLWGGMAYSPSGGTYAQLQLGLSDLMGNHAIGINVGVSGELENSNFIFSYLYLARRIDYGFGLFYLNDEIIYKILYSDDVDSDYFREREREYGFYTVFRYPFNKFWRLDFENLFSRKELRRDWWDDTKGKWIENYLPEYIQDDLNLQIKEEELVLAPQISIVHDNAIYGSVGPVSGSKEILIANRSFSDKNSYSILYGDFRRYLFFEKRYTYAIRLFGGVILGESDERFDLGYINGIRGFDDEDLRGKKKFVFCNELRFPFIDNLKISFPFPLYLYNIRGSAFIDVGSVWEENKELELFDNQKMKDLIMGLGFGARINLGYFVLKFDIAWSTDLEDASKPSYYLILSPDF
jgi:Tol biopolymer transport system component